MADKIKLVQGDSLPQLQAVIQDDAGVAVNITGATCLLKFRKVGESVLLATLVGSVTNGAAGTVVFVFGDTDLNVDAGDYEGEIEISFANSAGKQTVYDKLKFKIREDF